MFCLRKLVLQRFQSLLYINFLHHKINTNVSSKATGRCTRPLRSRRQRFEAVEADFEKVMSIQQSMGYEHAACSGCDQVIYDHFFLMVSHERWHIQCLKCVDCHVKLEDESSCFVKEGQVFCRKDYYRRYAGRHCTSCTTLIDSTEMVIRARDCVYHLSCFACEHCKCILTKGDSFGMSGDKIYCHMDYKNLLIEKQIKLAKKKRTPGRRPRKHKCDVMNCAGLAFQNDCMGFNARTQNSKIKRIRTSFKQNQLAIMKTYFAVNHNPDSKDLKQLSLKTGLVKRVLQVWFQNARAKYRKVLTQKKHEENIDLECQRNYFDIGSSQ